MPYLGYVNYNFSAGVYIVYIWTSVLGFFVQWELNKSGTKTYPQGYVDSVNGASNIVIMAEGDILTVRAASNVQGQVAHVTLTATGGAIVASNLINFKGVIGTIN